MGIHTIIYNIWASLFELVYLPLREFIYNFHDITNIDHEVKFNFLGIDFGVISIDDIIVWVFAIIFMVFTIKIMVGLVKLVVNLFKKVW